MSHAAHHLKILPQYATVSHAARVCGVPQQTLNRWVLSCRVPSIPWCGTRIVLLADVRRAVAHQPTR
jgi:hypothetical protein